ncbi:TolC family protein [Limnohabitans sp. Rim8]|uniref:TolC family protein n=1 Tax=Limnohabitans sp. Rim8 TaxID=1100718 RepID=UPI0025D3483E|nr:TolC family protein [Limnohabitans sp. Rim8]
MTHRFQTALKPVTLAVAAFILAGCSSLTPHPLEDKAVRDRAAADRVKMFDQQEPISAAITLDEAIARSLKYNLDLRLKKMEVAINEQLHEVSKYDMLPNLVVGAGYTDRSNYAGGDSRPLYSPQGSRPAEAMARTNSFSTSSDMDRRLRSVEFSWNVLDFGVSYYRAKQRADEFLIAQERKRRVIQTTVHDVRFAFLRALAAQKLAGEAEAVMKQAEQAIEQSRAAESRGAIPVQIALAYQRSLVDAVALLNTRRQELDFAKAELAALMSAPTKQFTLADMPEQTLNPLPTNLAVLEDTALLSRPELREEDLKKRISGDETRRQLMQAFPNLTLGLGQQYDSNRLLYNNDWVENSARISWNLLRVLSAPAVKKAGERQIETDDARRQALSMAIMTQTRIAALRYGLARSDLELAQKSMEVDARVAAVAKSGVSSKAETELELVRATARSAVSKYQRAIAYANAQAAYARIQHSLGQDFELGEIDQLTVAQLAGNVGKSLAATEKQLPTVLLAKAGPRPKVQLFLDEQQSGKALLSGVQQALARGGFDVVTNTQPDALKLQVSLKMGDAAKGLKTGEVVLSEVGKQSANYTATLPQAPREATYSAMGEAAITANVGHLREWIANRK